MYPDIFSHNFSESSNKCWSLSVVPEAQRNLDTCQFASCCVWANSWSWVLTRTGVCSVAGSTLTSAGSSLLLIRGSPGPGSPLEPHQPHSIAISSLRGCSEGLCEGFSEPWGYLFMKGNGDGTGQALEPFSTVPAHSTGGMVQMQHTHAVGRAGYRTGFRPGEGEGSGWASVGAAHPLQSRVYAGRSQAGLCSLALGPPTYPVPSFIWERAHSCTAVPPNHRLSVTTVPPWKGKGEDKEGTPQTISTLK